jgi:hypothetical protein
MHNAALNCHGDGLDTIGHAQLLKKVVNVCFHGAFGDVQRRADSLLLRPATIKRPTVPTNTVRKIRSRS